VSHQLEARVVMQVCNVVLGGGEEINQADDIMAVIEQAFAEMWAEKTGTAGDRSGCLLLDSSGP
jgi:hypothetical protein